MKSLCASASRGTCVSASGLEINFKGFEIIRTKNGSSQGQILTETVSCVSHSLETDAVGANRVEVAGVATEGPSWGYPRPVLGAIDPYSEPFCGHLSPKVDEIFQKRLLIEVRRALRGSLPCRVPEMRPMALIPWGN